MITDREIYQLYHNKAWIESLDGQEIAHFDVDVLENNWVLYKPKYTTSATSSDRFKTQKNRKGDVLLRKKNKPIGFKLVDTNETDISGTGRKYQANVANATLRQILDGNVYDLKLYGNYGVAFGSNSSGDFYAMCFEIEGTIKNDVDEEFVSIKVVHSQAIDSLYAYVDAIIYNGNFYVITYDGTITLTTTKFNISFGVNEGSVSRSFSIDSFNDTSENDLSNLSYTPVSSRIVTINGTPTETIGRIWTTTYSDSTIYLAYECSVPSARSIVTGVTEGVAIMTLALDTFLESSTGDLTYYVYDNLEDLPKVTDSPFCQCFIPDYLDEQQSFGHSITLDGDNLIVGSPEEDAFYVFDMSLQTTPDLFGSPPTTLPSNGTKIEKDFSLEQTPVFPVKMSGIMDFEIFGDVDILWYYPDGSVSTNAQASGFLSSVDTYYLFCDNFLNGDVKIVAGNTTGFIGSLNDIPNMSYYIDVSNTMASGHLGDNFQATYLDLENTNINQSDLETSAIVLDDAGNVSGTLTAKEGLPNITSMSGVAAINALLAKGWNVSVNMPFNDSDPELNIYGNPVSGSIDVFESLSLDPFEIYAYPVSGYFQVVPSGVV